MLKHNKCVDDDLMIKLFSNDKVLMDFLGVEIVPPDMFNPNGVIKKTKNNKDKGNANFAAAYPEKILESTIRVHIFAYIVMQMHQKKLYFKTENCTNKIRMTKQ